MTIVSLFNPARRRIILLCAATLLLHVLTIDWLGGHLGGLDLARPQGAEVMTAQLHPASPEPLAAPEPLARPQPKPAREPAPKPAPKPAMRAPEPAPLPEPLLPLPDPQAVAAADAPVANPAQGEPAADTASATGAVAAAPAMPPAGAAAPATAPVPAAPDSGPPEPAMARRYNVSLPASAEVDYAVRRVDADGTVWTGSASMSWKNDGSHYTLTEEVGISLLIARVNLLVSTSEGEIDDAGLAPVTATEKRKGRSMTATHFDRAAGQITFSASTQSYPLPPGAQDKASLPFQLAGIGRSDVNQYAGNIDIFVGEDKDASLFRFTLVGEEEIDTDLGRLVTWHLTRPPRPGSYSSRIDIWIAPGAGWYPVQIRNTEASGALTTQTIKRIAR